MQLSNINIKTWVVGALTLLTGIGTFWILLLWVQLTPNDELAGMFITLFLMVFGISFLVGFVTLVLIIKSKNYLKPQNVNPQTEHWKKVVYTGLLIGLIVVVVMVYFLNGK